MAMSASAPNLNQLLNRLRLRQLALLVSIQDCGTLGAASKQLGMTQPAATKMLAELENTLGHKLFERTGKGLKINEAGRQALLSFKGVRGTLEKLQNELHEMQQGHSGRLSVGSLMAASPTHLTLALVKIQKERPHLSLQVEVGTSEHLMAMLDEGLLDVVIGRVPNFADPYHFRPLAKEPISLVSAISHPLGKSKKLTFERLSQYSWVLPPIGTPMREAIDNEFFIHHTLLPKGLLETSSTMITVHLVSKTHMIAGLPQSVALGFQKHQMLKILAYKLDQSLASYGSVVRADRPLSKQTEHFLNLLHR